MLGYLQVTIFIFFTSDDKLDNVSDLISIGSVRYHSVEGLEGLLTGWNKSVGNHHGLKHPSTSSRLQYPTNTFVSDSFSVAPALIRLL